jgi:hypothetical protein
LKAHVGNPAAPATRDACFLVNIEDRRECILIYIFLYLVSFPFSISVV